MSSLDSSSDSKGNDSANISNLWRLFLLRNLMILVALAGIGIAHYFLHIHLSLASLFVVISSLVLFNIVVWFRTRSATNVTDNEIFFLLLVDICALAAILYFTGGATNPFIILFIFPLAISVTILPKRYAWVLAAISIALYSTLMFQFEPINISHSSHVSDEAFNLHILGMWMAFILAASLISYFVVQMGNTIRAQQMELQRAREVALRDRQIIALGTLAASTAHEMGTPLGTIHLIACEIENELQDAPIQVQKDIVTLKEQVARCKEALSNLSVSAGAVHLSSGNISNARVYLEDTLSNWKLIRTDVSVKTNWSSLSDSVEILVDKTLSQAIVNILDNAADASPDQIEWDACADGGMLRMEIRDRGRGLSDMANMHVGKQPYSEKDKGLGLGLFLSHAIIERFGGSVNLANREGGGLVTQFSVPLQARR